jgi:signal transduction histidine kinase
MPIRLGIGLGAQLLISHIVAAAVALAIAGPRRVTIALVAAGVVGIGLTLTVQRTLWLVSVALARLRGPQPPTELSPRWHGPLTGLVVRINELVTREREVHDLRESLLTQARDAAAQQERNRLARELHDSIKQQIFSIHMGVAAVQARWDTDPQGARQALGDVRRSAQEAMVEMNALLQQLSPAPVEKVGLMQALRDQCEALGYRTDAEVTVQFGELPADDRLPAGTQESLFRVAQEAFSNIARHARADHVRLYIGQRDADGPLRLEIRDDGQGFELDAAEGGMGLKNIHQRVLALGGQLAIDSAPGKGTALYITIPLMEPVVPQEEAMYQQDHTLNRTCLVGLGGGLALIAALFYPLYGLLPGSYVEGWPTGSGIVGFVLEIAAVLLAIAIGFLAARRAKAGTRQGGMLFGALAGGVAGAVLYSGIVAPAAGVIGSDLLLKHGVSPASGDADMIRLLVESLIKVVWWSHGSFWMALLAGTGLGAIGGLLAPPAAESPDWSDLRPAAIMILTTVALASAFSFIAAVAIFSQLEPAIRSNMAEYSISLETVLPLEGILLWPMGTPTVFYLASLIVLYFPLRAEIKNDPSRLSGAQVTAAVLGLVSLGVPGYLQIANPGLIRARSALGAAAVATVASSLVLSGLYLATFIKVRQRRRALGLDRPDPVRTVAAIGALLSPVIIGWAISLPPFLGILVGLGIIIADIVLIVVLRRQPKRSPSAAITLARLRLTISRTINGGLASVIAMIVPPMATISVIVSIVMIIVRFVPVLASYAQEQSYVPNYTLVELVHAAYLTQARAFLIVIVVAIVNIGLTMLITSGIIAIEKRRSARTTETAQ